MQKDTRSLLIFPIVQTALHHAVGLEMNWQKIPLAPLLALTGVMTGSCNVITLNINRIVQDWALTHTLNGTPLIKGKKLIGNPLRVTVIENDLKNYVTRILERVYKYHIAFQDNAIRP